MGNRSTRIIYLGVTYLVLGLIALAFSASATIASVVTLGFIFLIAGVAQIAYGLQGRKTGQLWPHVGVGCLFIACSALIIANPVFNALSFTLIIGFLLIANGLTKIIGASVERLDGWGWFAFNGLVSLALGVFVLATFPISALWTIGVIVGVDLVVAGLAMVGLGVSVKQAKKEVREMRSQFLDESDEVFESNRPKERRNPEDRGMPLH